MYGFFFAFKPIYKTKKNNYFFLSPMINKIVFKPLPLRASLILTGKTINDIMFFFDL